MSGDTPYAAAHARGIADPGGYWLEQAGLITWYEAPTMGLDGSTSPSPT